MRFFYCLMILASAVPAWTQNEPCLAGIQDPACGIRVTMDPPVKAADGNTLWVPNEITVDVPGRLHASKVQLNSAPPGSQAADDFKLLAETAHYKRTGGVERFKLQLKSCPGADSAFQVVIVAARVPYPIAVDYTLRCQPAPANGGYPPPTK